VPTPRIDERLEVERDLELEVLGANGTIGRVVLGGGVERKRVRLVEVAVSGHRGA